MKGNAGMKLGRSAGIFLITFFVVFFAPVSASPALPGEFYGQVYINGNPAPADRQKVTSSIPITSRTIPLSATTRAAGFSFQTSGLVLLVITLGVILRK